jgi:hypothetical protein
MKQIKIKKMLRQYEQENPAAWLELVRIVVATSTLSMSRNTRFIFLHFN